MQEKIKIINDYVAAHDTYNAAARLHNELNTFIEKEHKKIPFDDLRPFIAARDALSKYVWGDAHYRAWDKVEESLKQSL